MNVWKSWLAKVTGLLSESALHVRPAAKGLDSPVPPVDLDQPVTNPRLVAVIRKHQRIGSEATAVELFEELTQAVLLVGIVVDKPPARVAEREVEFRAGDRFGVVQVQDENEQTLLALFTDHEELHDFTDEANSTLVMPTDQAIAFVLEQDYDGIVVNPSSDASLRLDAAFLRTLMQQA
jgi:hypothetical protein